MRARDDRKEKHLLDHAAHGASLDQPPPDFKSNGAARSSVYPGALDEAPTLRIWVAALATATALTAAGAAAKAPPLPQATGHRTVTVVARGIPTPTEFAVFAGRLFVGGYGDEKNPKAPGGVYLLGGGKAIRVGSPQHVYGLAATKNTLYLSTSRALTVEARRPPETELTFAILQFV